MVPEWPTLVGAQIAAVTEPSSITRDGTLFVAVKTSAWMSELSLMEPQLLVANSNGGPGATLDRCCQNHWRVDGANCLIFKQFWLD